MTWVNLVLAVLQIAKKLMEYGQQQKWIKEGEALILARESAEILRKSQYAKQALEEFAGKSDSDIDDFLRGLEPREPDGK